MDQKLTSSSGGYSASGAVLHAYVVAPMSLSAGYEFTASLPDQPNVTFEVQVVCVGPLCICL